MALFGWENQQKRIWMVWDRSGWSCGCSQGSYDIQQPKWHATVKPFDADPAASPAHWGEKQKMRSADAKPQCSQDAEVIWCWDIPVYIYIYTYKWWSIVDMIETRLHHFHDSNDCHRGQACKDWRRATIKGREAASRHQRANLPSSLLQSLNPLEP